LSSVFWGVEFFASAGAVIAAMAAIEPTKIARLIRMGGSPFRNQLIS
jgi:hypothetical protein